MITDAINAGISDEGMILHVLSCIRLEFTVA
jgi:hypothetical protein